MSTPESNGRKPAVPLEPEKQPRPAMAADDDVDELDEDWVDDEPSTGLEIAFTPRQILGGFALLAALVLLILRRKRR